nr:hypothetical protein BaRGS_003130 [Batillaria attramentaria]KAG5703841.1 hypothetical protein BaRGS_031475 [Batillaria attramentaria]
MTSHWEFYSNTGICIPLPITSRQFAGHGYAFGIIIVLNFVMFLLIAAGQVSVYLSIRANSMTLTDTALRKPQDLTIARRLVSISVSDFLCWFPIGVLGLLSSQGIPVPSEANVSMAVLVLPLNSVLNPFLYNLILILEKRRRVKEEKLLEKLTHYMM